MPCERYVVYSANEDTDPSCRGCWHERADSYASLEEAKQRAERLLDPSNPYPQRVAIYQLVEVMREEPPKPNTEG